MAVCSDLHLRCLIQHSYAYIEFVTQYYSFPEQNVMGRSVTVIAILALLAISFSGVAPAAANFASVKAAFKTNQALFKPMVVLIGDRFVRTGRGAGLLPE